MNVLEDNPIRSLQPFEPDPSAVYTLEMTAQLTKIPRHTIVVYFKHGLVSPVADPECGGYYFNDEAVRLLRRIEQLRSEFGINLPGTRLILDLLNEVNHLREEVRFLREETN
jgi:DNA-binding transcriptional MerR regulator